MQQHRFSDERVSLSPSIAVLPDAVPDLTDITNAALHEPSILCAPPPVHAVHDVQQNLVNIEKLRRKLPRRSFLRRIDAYWQTPGPLTEEKFVAILTTLRDPDPARWRERMLCAWLLGHALLTPEQQREAAHALGNALDNRHAPRDKRILANLRNTVMAAAPPAIGLTLAYDATILVNGDLWRSDDFRMTLFIIIGVLFISMLAFIPICLLLTTLVFPIIAARNMLCNNRVRIASALTLSRLRAPESVGPLARAVLDLSLGVRSVAEPGLRECLPLLTSGHYGQVDADTVPALCRLLDLKKERLFANHDHTEQFVLDILYALGKVGDGRAVPHVESVAADGWTESARNAAQQILPGLLDRRKQENDPHTLLRGAAQPQAGSEHLLRPAANACDSAPEQLLRPGMRKP